MAAYLIYGHPDYFTGFYAQEKMLKLLAVINNNVFFPLLVVVLLKALGFSDSVLLKTQKERIVPYIASITFFFWTYHVFKNQPETPLVLVNMCRGMFFTSAAALLLNNYFKISMHGMGVGGAAGLMLFTVIDGSLHSGLPLIVTFLAAGAVLSARKVVSDHNWFELITGFILGMISQLIPLWF
ncbi:MAG: hypothetical protein RL766_2142 [Bacteroidota bacterium]